jgi:hypothetical protein
MIDLSRLRVSLTKHGAHKVAELIKNFSQDEILNNAWDKHKGIRINLAQTMKNLSVDLNGRVPSIWEEVKQLGDTEIENLVLIAIIFSHHELIKTMIEAQTKEMRGTVERGKVIDGKAYTNFACILDELGFAKEHTVQHISYDLARLFSNRELPKFVRALLVLKLKAANWDGKSDLIEECLRLNLHKVFSVTPEFFKSWLEGEVEETIQETKELPEEKFAIANGAFQFRKGHTPKLEGEIDLSAPKHVKKANLLHNEIQNKLYEYLVGLCGEDAVGTEVSCGYGTSVDIVVKDGDDYIFYEIKTDISIKSCIRHAISQLLEYAFWTGEENAKKLIIVSQNPITKEVKTYLNYLRSRFGLPLYYQRFDLHSEKLENIF